MRLIFAGTPEFARTALQHLHAAGHDIALVLSQPDRPSGRGMKLQPSAVKQLALEIGAPVAQPTSLRLDGKYPEEAALAREQIWAANAQAMVVAAYGLILPQWVLEAMRGPGPTGAGPQGLGCLNIHASLLPRWRGAAPIHRAIEAGDRETGVTIMQMDAGLDTGDMLLVKSLPIAPDDTTASLHDRLAELGGQMIVQALAMAEASGLTAQPQPSDGVTYAHKIEKSEAPLDWRLPAAVLDRRIRAFNPFPGASFVLQGETVKAWEARPQDTTDVNGGLPGTVLAADAQGVVVATGSGALRLTQLQRPGGKRLGAGDFLRGFALSAGTVLQGPAADKALP